MYGGARHASNQRSLTRLTSTATQTLGTQQQRALAQQVIVAPQAPLRVGLSYGLTFLAAFFDLLILGWWAETQRADILFLWVFVTTILLFMLVMIKYKQIAIQEDGTRVDQQDGVPVGVPVHARNSELSINRLVKQLSVDIPASGQDWSDGDNTCVICMEPMVRVARSIQPSDPAHWLDGEAVEGATSVRLPCRHYFHHVCIAKWWSTQASSPSADVSCPICHSVVRLREQLEQQEEETVETAEGEPQQPHIPQQPLP